MKKILSLALVSGLLVFGTSCSKDDDDNNNNNNNNNQNPSNELKIESDTYVLSGAYIEDFGTSLDSSYPGTNFDIYMYTDGLTYDSINDDFNGDGYFVYFESFTNSASGLDAGTYNFDLNATSTGTFDIGVVVEVVNGQGSQASALYATGGSYTVVVNGTNDYTINGSITVIGQSSTQPKTVTFNYSGKFEVF